MYYSLKNVYLWRQLQESSSSNDTASYFFSVIIPVRNEAANIQNCIQHILAQSYPNDKFEIVVVNDHSEDNTGQIVRGFEPKGVRILELCDYLPKNFSGSYKKKALEYGIANSKGDWIVTTDGDVWMGPAWLQTIANTIRDTNAQMICGPVLYEPHRNAFERFQCLDAAGMMLITAAGFASKKPQLCNGANLAIRRSTFESTEGYRGNDHIASGDDLFLLEKVCKADTNAAKFTKSRSAIVYTRPTAHLRGYLSQRLRWGKKTAKLEQKKTLLTLSLLWLNCINLFIVILLIPFFGWPFVGLALFLWTSKTFADYLLLKRSTVFWQRGALMRGFVRSEVYHTSLLALLGIMGLFKIDLKWKGRNV